jgi:hypothetical protein
VVMLLILSCLGDLKHVIVLSEICGSYYLLMSPEWLSGDSTGQNGTSCMKCQTLQAVQLVFLKFAIVSLQVGKVCRRSLDATNVRHQNGFPYHVLFRICCSIHLTPLWIDVDY